MVWGVFGVRAQIRRAEGSPVGMRCNAPERNWCLTPITQPAVLAKNRVELELAALRQSLALIRFWLRSSAQPDRWRRGNRYPNTGRHPESRKRETLPGRESQQTVMFARERSARDQMESPSIAQRGEGGARGGSGESRLLSEANRRRCVMPLSAPESPQPVNAKNSQKKLPTANASWTKTAIYLIVNRRSSP